MPETLPYNPHEREDGNAGKIWELLRRNPEFRRFAKTLFEKHKSTKLPGALSQDFEHIDAQNPLAGFVLRWMFKPKLVEFNCHRSREYFGSPWTTWNAFENGYFDLDYDTVYELEDLIVSEQDGESYPGPLTVIDGPFTFETGWRNTPELFQFHFRWLWREYEIGGPSEGLPSPDALTRGKYEPGSIDWRFLEVREDGTTQIEHDTVYELRRLQFLLAHHELFAVPLVVTHKKAEVNLKSAFKKLLANPARSKKLVVACLKYPWFLGTAKQWLVFASCYNDTKYDLNESGTHFGRLGSGTAQKKFIESQIKSGKWRKNSDQKTHVEKEYDKMEALMNATFPAFDFAKILSVGLAKAPADVLKNTAQIALTACVSKLRTLHPWFPQK